MLEVGNWIKMGMASRSFPTSFLTSNLWPPTSKMVGIPLATEFRDSCSRRLCRPDLNRSAYPLATMQRPSSDPGATQEKLWACIKMLWCFSALML